MSVMISRRQCLSAIAGSAVAASTASAGAGIPKLPLCAFSKHFQWTDLKETAALCASFGYDGIDITLRPGGHVLPERVEDDLPKAVETIRKAGLSVPMVTSDIIDVKTPHAERVMRTLKSQGILRYRWGGFKYVDGVPIPKQLSEFQARTRDLAAMNKQHGLCAMYHTHSGANQVGASFWDLYLILKDYSPDQVSANFDIGHATVEGGLGGWLHSARLLLPYTRGVALKDFKWTQNEKGEWIVGWCALGQGMVNFRKFLPMVKAAGFEGPLQLHMEYPELGGADNGKTSFTIPKDRLLSIMRRDVVVCRGLLRDAGLA